MEPQDLVAIIVTVSIAVSGWVVAHWLSTKREIEQKKREFRVKYLREAYLKIANLCDRGQFPRDIADLQDALNDIQLFGEESQIELSGKVVTSLGSHSAADFNELLKQLRNEIRGHIGLSALSSTRWYIRAERDKVTDTSESGMLRQQGVAVYVVESAPSCTGCFAQYGVQVSNLFRPLLNLALQRPEANPDAVRMRNLIGELHGNVAGGTQDG